MGLYGWGVFLGGRQWVYMGGVFSVVVNSGYGWGIFLRVQQWVWVDYFVVVNSGYGWGVC